MQHFIEETTIGSAWIKSVRAVMEHGKPVIDDKGLIGEISPLYIQIRNPLEEDDIVKRFGDHQMLEDMHNLFQKSEPVVAWGYSYGQRLTDFEGVNQLQEVVNKLRENPFAKSATINLLYPGHDHLHLPCLTTIDCKLREGILHVHGFFRSQDVGKKMYADCRELLRISELWKKELQAASIVLYITICSAHIYIKDLDWLQNIVSHFTEKKD